MNLLTDPWLPVRRRNSPDRIWIAPCDITSDYETNPVVALEAPRPDFNGALMQFLIGLLQTACPPEDEIEWEERLDKPMAASELTERFAAYRDAFVLDGDGRRFMQDKELGENIQSAESDLVTEGDSDDEQDIDNEADGEEQPASGPAKRRKIRNIGIGALLVGYPSEGQTLKQNKDHFIKRGGISRMCARCAAAGLYLLQATATGFGSGHNASLRGVGPLTTVLTAEQSPTLWRDVWLNVLPRPRFQGLSGDPSHAEVHRLFPWTNSIETLKALGPETVPEFVRPEFMFWAMPRRIWLKWSQVRGNCEVCGDSVEQITDSYLTQAGGLHFDGQWRHPLSPYPRQGKPGKAIKAVQPQQGGIGYRHWLGLVIGVGSDVQPAPVILDHCERSDCRMWAFGFEFDKKRVASLRAWQEAKLPIYMLSQQQKELLAHRVTQWVSAADMASKAVVVALKSSWFRRLKDAAGNYGFAEAAFWSATERPFYEQLERLVRFVRRAEGVAESEWNAERERWRKLLEREALRLFEHFVDSGDPAVGDLRRRAEAYRTLKASLSGKKCPRRSVCRSSQRPIEKRRGASRWPQGLAVDREE